MVAGGPGSGKTPAVTTLETTPVGTSANRHSPSMASTDDVELLATLLGGAGPSAHASRQARALLRHHQSLRGLVHYLTQHAPYAGGSPSRKQQRLLLAALEFARRCFEQSLQRENAMTGPQATRQFLCARLADRPYETFCCLYLDNRHRVIAFAELFRGTIDGAAVHPREVIREVLAHNAAAVILAHNHPSGVAEASRADELITRRLSDALALIDVRVLDHIIVGDGATLSFAERGLL